MLEAHHSQAIIQLPNSKLPLNFFFPTPRSTDDDEPTPYRLAL
jgi:hypothetical protein